MKQVRISSNNFAPLAIVLAAAKNGAAAYFDNDIKCNIAVNIDGWITAVTPNGVIIHGWAGEFKNAI